MLSSYLKLPICLFLWVWCLFFLSKIEYIKILQFFSRLSLSPKSSCIVSQKKKKKSSCAGPKIKYIKILQFLSQSDLTLESSYIGPIKIMTCVKILIGPVQLDAKPKPNHLLIGLPLIKVKIKVEDPFSCSSFLGFC